MAMRKIKPSSDNTYDIGGSSARWDNIYATNGTIQTSDRNEKTQITKHLGAYNMVATVSGVTKKQIRK